MFEIENRMMNNNILQTLCKVFSKLKNRPMSNFTRIPFNTWYYTYLFLIIFMVNRIELIIKALPMNI